MKLYVVVVEARNLTAKDTNGFSDPFVKVSLGNTKAKTSVVYKNLNPSWNEEFVFNVSDLDEELKVSVWDEDKFTNDFLGQLKIPVSQVLDAEQQTLGHQWFPLQKRSEKSKIDVSGEVKLEVSLVGRKFISKLESQTSRVQSKLTSSASFSPPRLSLEDSRGSPSRMSLDEAPSVVRSDSADSSEVADMVADQDSVPPLVQSESPRIRAAVNGMASSIKEGFEVDKSSRRSMSQHAFTDKLTSMFHKRGRNRSSKNISPSASLTSETNGLLFDPSTSTESSLVGEHSSESGEEEEELVPLAFFQDDDKSVGQSEEDLPPPLPQGFLVDDSFAVSMKEMNALLFKPDSAFIKELTEVQKTTEYSEEPWKKPGVEPMRRNVKYRKAATALVKAVFAYEEQTYLRADDKGFAVLCVVQTPDVMYGKTFLCELLFVITPGTPTEAGQQTCHLTISWRMNFVQNTMMKGMINNGAAAGLKDNFSSFSEVLAKYAKPLDGGSSATGQLASLAQEVMPRMSDWQLAKEYFGNYTVLFTVLALFFVLLHIFLSKTRGKQGLEFWNLDLPDSLGELFVCALITRQVERVGRMGQKFLLARLKANDHGVKAQGDGWLLTIALVEGENLYSLDTDGSCDPYVVFTCNGKIRTSSVILGTNKPQWREVYEFDATEDPPSTLDIEVFDYDGPFSQAESLGSGSINFLKTREGELADIWVPLVGKMAQVHGCKLHLRIVLTNTKDGDFTEKEKTEKVMKDAQIKIVKRSPKLNTQFQKLFSLPAEEFLINDYACAIKKKIPIQGRLFLSVRQLGFYSNLFGHKTKFSFLWEDIEEIKEVAPSRGVLLYPSITITTRKGRALDARSGSKGVDTKGRLRFQFLSFVRPGPAFRTIITLWKNRTLSVEQQMELVASVEAGDMKYAVSDRQGRGEDSQTFLGVEDAHMSELANMESTLTVKQLFYLLEHGELDKHVMQLFGVNNYKNTHWEMVGDDPKVKRRQVSYTLNRQQCRFGSAVTSIQQKTISDDAKTGLLEEVLTLHDVPFGDHFLVQVKKEIETTSDDPPVTRCKISSGVAWHKSAGFQKKITKNILRYMTQFLNEYFEMVKKVASAGPPDATD